jgi:hypothetical protein
MARTEARVIDEPARGRSDAAADPGARSDGSVAVTPGVPRVVAGSQPSDVPLDLEAATSQALMALAGRSADPSVCPFLRAGADGDMPPESAAAGHRCVALAPAVAVSERQRQLVCQVAGHPACPRHVRGEAAVRSSLAPGLGRRSRAAPAAIGTAVVLLLVTAAVAATSGLATPGDDVAGGGGAEASDPAGASSARPTDGDGQAPSPSADAPGASGLPSATVAPLATVSPTLVATRDLPVAWRKLEPCPASDPCYLYVVKRGDTLGVIADRFDTTVNKLRKLNPKLGDPSTIRVGSTIRVPPPPS